MMRHGNIGRDDWRDAPHKVSNKVKQWLDLHEGVRIS